MPPKITSSLSVSFYYSFLPEMVTRFGYKEEDKGYYVGVIASAYFAGRTLFSYIWGLLSDRFGRKAALLSTVALHGIFALMFGFSRNIIMAITCRFLTGASDGVGVTTKTILYEISDNTNQALGMVVIALAFGIGSVIGPSAGGFLASPADKYPSVFSPDGFFGQFPYVLSSTPCWVASMVACILIKWKMKESLNKHAYANGDVSITENEGKDINETHESMHVKSRSLSSLIFLDANLGIYTDPNLDEPFTPRDTKNMDFIDANIGYSPSANCLSTFSDNTAHDKELLGNLMCNDVCDESMRPLTNDARFTESAQEKYAYPSLNQHTSDSYNHVLNKSYDCNSSTFSTVDGLCIDTCPNPIVPVLNEQPLTGNDITTHTPSSRNCCMRLCVYCKNSGLVFLLSTSDVRRVVFLTGFYAFGVVGFHEIYSTWVSTQHRFDGLGYNTDELGTVYVSILIPLLIIQLYFFPFCVRKFGLIKTFVMWGALLTVLITSLPTIHMISGRPRTLFTILVILTTIERLAIYSCYGAMSLFVNNSVSPEYAGRVNGMSLAIAAIFRTAAPALTGSIFAWSISQGCEIWPLFNVNFTFFILGLVFWISTIFVVMLPRHLNTQKK